MSDRRRRFSKSRSRVNRFQRNSKSKAKEKEKESNSIERSREKELKEKDKEKEEVIHIKPDKETKEETKGKHKTKEKEKEKEKVLNNIVLPSQNDISTEKEITNQYPTIKLDKSKLLKLLKCPLCNGFYRTPYTINECMHTFCRSCIFKYFSSSVQRETCPICKTKIGGRPIDSLIFDNYLDSLLNILFPKFEELDKNNIKLLYKTFRDMGNPLPGDEEEAKLKMPSVKIYIMPENSKDNKFTAFLVQKNFNVESLKLLIKKKTGKENIDCNLICVKYKGKELEKDEDTMEVIDTRYGFDQDKNIFYYSFKKKVKE